MRRVGPALATMAIASCVGVWALSFQGGTDIGAQHSRMMLAAASTAAATPAPASSPSPKVIAQPGSASLQVTALERLVIRARIKEADLVDQVQGLWNKILAERATIKACQRQIANSIQTEYMLAPNSTLAILASTSWQSGLDTQITLSELSSGNEQALHTLEVNLKLEKAQEVTLHAAQEQAAVEEAKIQASETIAAFEAAGIGVPSGVEPAIAGAYIPAATPSPSAAPGPTVPAPVPTAPFTVSTNLTLPSGITLRQIKALLQGTPLEPDAQYFLNAASTYHVSAIYLVSDAILETGFGTSQIYQTKHNLFGFEAYDSNPGQDSASFPSDQACISQVAWYVSVNYLTLPGSQVANYPGQPGQVPTGQFYHGPTPAGMNVDYATDPNWSVKIAAIGAALQSIPPDA